MSCPKCGCQVTYVFQDDDLDNDDSMERCSACGNIFYFDEAGPDNDE
jgi:predicted  nucleic acid-binding Zn-ribbon protein